MASALTPDVLVVGAGPTGLLSAGLLQRCGLSVRIVDKSPTAAAESRAFGVQARTLELMLSLGLAEAFLEKGVVASGAQVFVDGAQVAELDFDDIGRPDTPYAFLLMVPQWDVEEILGRDLRGRGIEVERKVEVTGLRQTAEDVIATTARGEEIHAAYVIGADGAHSVVRKALGLRYDGAPYPQSFLLADCRVDWPLDHDHLKIFLRGRNLAIFLPLRGREVARIMSVVPAGADVEVQGAGPATLEEVQQALDAAITFPATLSAPRWLSRYRIHHRGVDRYASGRAFVAGDAAHIHSPAGGQGMNTGLQDAANLCWKIAAVVKGGAPASLLDTYHDERWPIGQKILGFTDRFFSGMASQTSWVAGLRNHLVPLLAGTLTRSEAARARAYHFVSQLGIRYHEGAFVQDAAAEVDVGVAAGRRAPNADVTRGLDVFALIGGYRFHVLALSREPLAEQEIAALGCELDTLPRSLGVPLQTHVVAHSLIGRDPRIVRVESNQVFSAYGLSRSRPQALYLIRPDGYVAWRADRLDVEGLRAFLKRLA